MYQPVLECCMYAEESIHVSLHPPPLFEYIDKPLLSLSQISGKFVSTIWFAYSEETAMFVCGLHLWFKIIEILTFNLIWAFSVQAVVEDD